MPRSYAPEFRRQVVELVRQGRSVGVVAAEIGVSEATVYRWRQQDSMEDALGNEHKINERIDLWNVWEITKVSHRRLPPDYEKQTADAVKDIRDEVRKLERLAQTVMYRVWPPVFADQETPPTPAEIPVSNN